MSPAKKNMHLYQVLHTKCMIYLTLSLNNVTLILDRGVVMSKNLNLKSSRAAKDMSQKDLADATGVTRQTINAIEKGDYNPSIKLCISICKVLGKTLDQLFWEGDEDA